MKMSRTIPKHYKLLMHYRPGIKQITKKEIEDAFIEIKQDSELENIINKMDVAVHHCKEETVIEEYKIVIGRKIIKYGYENLKLYFKEDKNK